MSRTVIRGGLVITASDEMHADVLIEDGRVVALAASGTPTAESWTAERTIDAAGKYVIPGRRAAPPPKGVPVGGPNPHQTLERGPPG
ncbi:dihydropyrimidinase, partial [Streptomyces sp. NPDC059668]